MRNEIELPEREDDFEEDVSVEDVAEAIAEETPEAPKNAEAQKRVQKIGYADRPVAVVSVRITNADWKVIRKLRDIYDVFNRRMPYALQSMTHWNTRTSSLNKEQPPKMLMKKHRQS